MKAFTTQQCPADKQLHAWQEIMSDVYYSLEVKRSSSDGLRGNLRQYDIGCLSITSFDSDEQRHPSHRYQISREAHGNRRAGAGAIHVTAVTPRLSGERRENVVAMVLAECQRLEEEIRPILDAGIGATRVSLP